MVRNDKYDGYLMIKKDMKELFMENMNPLETLEEYKRNLVKSIDIDIKISAGDDDYHIGVRNGLRTCKAFITGETPEYE